MQKLFITVFCALCLSLIAALQAQAGVCFVWTEGGSTGCAENVTADDCSVAVHAGIWDHGYYLSGDDCGCEFRGNPGFPWCKIDGDTWRYVVSSYECNDEDGFCREHHTLMMGVPPD